MKLTSFNGIGFACLLSIVPLQSYGDVTNYVTIKRDTYGTPHIYAKNDYDLFYGYGYVLAEDRLYQLEMLKRSTQGTVAAALGPKFIAFDKKQRSLFWPADIKAQVDRLDDNTKNIFKGFAAGINSRIAAVRADKENLMPFEFKANGFQPELWTDYDVVMMFVGSMLLRFGDFNTELENQAFLTDLIKAHGEKDAWQIFNAVIPTRNDFAPTTIPKRDWTRSKPIATSRQENGADPQTAPQIATLNAPQNAIQIAAYSPQERGHAFSNALVLGPERLTGAKAILINGPQFGWYVPAYTYSVGFHTPDWDAVGNVPVGYPLPMFGYNKFITWGSTWAVMDNVDIFRESLNPENPLQYKHKGAWKDLRIREEVITVKGEASVSFTAKYSLHGPIVHSEGQYAYAKMRGWAGRELDTITGWIAATKAKNHASWLKAVGKSALNVNWYFADKDGNIGYGSMGAYPIRAKGHDNRLPVSGEGDKDWTAIRSPSKNPQIFNPSSHYVANWNNKPGAGVDNPDEWWASWSEADRIKILDDAVKKAGKMTEDQAWDVMMKAAFTDPNAAYFKPLMLLALEKEGKTNPLYSSIHKILHDWDGTYGKTTGNGTANRGKNSYEHGGNAIFRSWLGQMMTDVLADDLSGNIGGAISHITGYGTPENPTPSGLNISVGLKLLFEVMQGRGDYDFLNGKSADDLWITSLDKALIDLTARFGKDLSQWHLPVPATRFKHVNFLGIPQALPSAIRDDMPAMNRGTENNMTVFHEGNNPDGPTGYEVVPPGQSGFIAPNGQKSKHYDDQYLMYQNQQKKQTWLSEKDVTAHTERTYKLAVPQP